MTDILLFSFCLFTMLATLVFALYLKKYNKKKIDTILFRSPGGMAFLFFCALSSIMGDDELGIFGFICYVWTIETMLIVLSQLVVKSENIGIGAAFLLSSAISCFFAFIFHEPHWAYTIFAAPIVIYLIFYGIARGIENKLRNNFPSIYNGAITLSLCVFLINIILILGIAVYDHRIFGYLKPFWR